MIKYLNGKLTLMVVQGCNLDLKCTNTLEWESVLAATSKTCTVLYFFRVLGTGARPAKSLHWDGVDDFPSRNGSCE